MSFYYTFIDLLDIYISLQVSDGPFIVKKSKKRASCSYNSAINYFMILSKAIRDTFMIASSISTGISNFSKTCAILHGFFMYSAKFQISIA